MYTMIKKQQKSLNVISTHEDYYDIRFNIRKVKLETILDNFIEYVETEIKDALQRISLGKSLDYAKKHLLTKLQKI